jgi:hypothetical protein
MSKLKLPNITLVALTSVDIPQHIVALERSCKGIEWGAVKLITEIQCNNIDEWNHAIVFDLRRFIDTEFCMLIHADGFVVNPESWRPEFLNYDFIGAPWPMPTDDYSYRTPDGEIVRVGNSVSIRSKNMLELPYQTEVAWRSYFGNTNEDGYLTVHNRRLFQHCGARYAPIEVAKWFSRELDIPENADVENPFAFHMADNKPGRNIKYKHLMA